jgi:hypothetical protein
MPEPQSSKSYVRPDKTAVLTCPHCGQQKAILADPFRGHKHKLKVRCLCNKHFTAFLEFRKRPRKLTLLRGTFINKTQGSGIISDLTIRDLSVIGLTFTSVNADSINLNDALGLKFNLDDEYRTEIRRDVIVRTIRQGGGFGCEIQISYGEHFSGPLEYYVSKL